MTTDETAGQDTPLSRENVLTGHENEVGSAQPDTVILDTSELVHGRGTGEAAY